MGMAPEQPADNGGTELGRFLRARRSQVTPADVGFAPGTGVRRTPGLRREEVAALAGVSIDYFTRLERGKETRPSPSVTDALARALKLDPDEHETASPAPPAPPARPEPRRPQPSSAQTLHPDPAYMTSRPSTSGGHPARWRSTGLATPDLLLKSPEFARLWERYDVTRRTAAQRKTFQHPTVGALTLGFQGMHLEGTPGQRLGVYLARSRHPRLRRYDPARHDRPGRSRKQPRNNGAVTAKERTDP